MKGSLLVKCLSGSHAYGLAGPDSDIDERGIYVSTNSAEILGLEEDLFFEDKSDGKDIFYFELRHYLKCLRKTNVIAIEILFCEPLSQAVTWEFVRENRSKLIDSERLFVSLLGYMNSERRLLSGERKGAIGGKRFEAVKKFGFSPKNASHLLRLAYCGKVYFETAQYPVNIEKHDPTYAEFLQLVKFSPQSYSLSNILNLVEIAEQQLKEAYNKCLVRTKFDSAFANELCHLLYRPYICCPYGLDVRQNTN